MTQVAGGGLTREVGEFWNMPVKDATTLDDAGYVLKYVVEDSTNKVDLCGATDTPRCVNFRSQRDPFDLRETDHGDLTGAEIGEKGIPVFREGWAKLKVATNNSAIVRGDPLVVDSGGGGKVDLYVETALLGSSSTTLETTVEARLDELARVVGQAEEDIAVGTTAIPGKDKVLTYLTIGKVARDEA